MAWQYFQPPVIPFIAQRELDKREETTSSTQSITLNSNALPPFSPERRLPQHPGLARDLPAVNGLVGHLAVVDGPLAPAEGLALAPSQRAGAAHPGASLQRARGDILALLDH